MKKIIYSFIAITLFLLVGTQYASAATLYIDGPELFPTRHESIVNVFLRTQFDNVNAVEGKVVFPEHVSLKSVWSGGSVMSLWVENPRIDNNEVSFSGVVPGGISENEEALLFQVVFVGDKEGSGTVDFQGVSVLLDDGAGTLADIYTESFTLSVLQNATAYAVPKDTRPPEEFGVTISKDEAVFGGRYFAVFRTHDKESGVDYYEAQENKNDEIDESAWVRVESPYELVDQKQRSYLFIKAVDRSGNTRVTTHKPQKVTPLQLYAIYGIIIIIVLCVWRRYENKKRKKKNK